MLEHFFGSKTRLKLLQTFFRSPERAFYLRELARLTETQLNAVRREIANLERLQLVAPVASPERVDQETGTERSKYYQLRNDSMLFPELKALLVKAEVLEEKELIEELKEKAGEIKLLLLTGVFTDEPEVSTDVLVVGKLHPAVIAKLIKQYEFKTDKTIRYTLMDPKEFQERREIGDRFLFTIFEAKHLFVVNEYHLS